MFKVTEAPLDPQPIVQGVLKESHGAVVTFLGVVRGWSGGRRVLYMEYEAYKEMAEKKLVEIGQEIRQRWQVEDVALYHRVGRLEVGVTSLVVVVAAPHRGEAFAACHYAVDRLKEIVPIWKKEVFEDGGVWVEGEPMLEEK